MAPGNGLTRLGQKRLEAKAKHRWLAACAAFRGFNDQPGVLRTAIVLFELYDPKLGYAWPSRNYIAERLGATPQSVSKWLRILAGCRAIERVPAGQAQPEVLAITKRNAKRANYYRLNMEWAEIVLGNEALEDIWYDDEGPLSERIAFLVSGRVPF